MLQVHVSIILSLHQPNTEEIIGTRLVQLDKATNSNLLTVPMTTHEDLSQEKTWNNTNEATRFAILKKSKRAFIGFQGFDKD